jgi:hypothetical protein
MILGLIMLEWRVVYCCWAAIRNQQHCVTLQKIFGLSFLHFTSIVLVIQFFCFVSVFGFVNDILFVWA